MGMRLFAPGLLMMALAASVAGLCAAQANRHSTGAVSDSAAGAQKASVKGGAAGDGERVFTQNCSRCHNAPEGFPPRISGTIAHHMRVRANLSRDDEKALLHFLNP